MSKHKRNVTFSESDSGDEFMLSSAKSLKAKCSSNHSKQHFKRRKSIFDEGDTEPRGKVQMSFEESLAKATKQAKAEKEAQKNKPTLLDYFSPSTSSKSAPVVKKEIAIEDFFSSSRKSCASPVKASSHTLVAETPPAKVEMADIKRKHTPIKTEKHTPTKSKESHSNRRINRTNTDCMPSLSPSGSNKMSKVEELSEKYSPKIFKATDSPLGSAKKQYENMSEVDSPIKKDKKKKHIKERHTNLVSSSLSTENEISPTAIKENVPLKSPVLATPKKNTPPQDIEHAPLTGERTASARKAFFTFQNREGPQQLGSRPIPKNTSTCFKGHTFVLTGVLECVERDEAQALIERGGGRVTKSISKKTTYLIVGRDSGASKLDKAIKLGVKQISEDDFFEMVNAGFGKQKEMDYEELLSTSGTIALSTGNQLSPDPLPLTNRPLVKMKKQAKEESLTSTKQMKKTSTSQLSVGTHELWVEKYRPSRRAQLVGQNGPASPANRLFSWLSAWVENFAAGRKAKAYSSAPPWGSSSSDDGAWARAALLSGPPGIGKTTSAMVVCAELGFATIEMNASDARSKRSLREQVAEALGMRSLSTMLTMPANAGGGLTSHVLIMDEVDGMAGNEDRGGMQELIGIIKTSKVPIICLCNDRQSAKVRSLANYCLDLRFHRPRVEQMKAAVLSMACREGISVGSQALTEIIAASNQDMRQVINSVQMWCMDGGAEEKEIEKGAASVHKNLRLGPFDVIRKVFQPDMGPGGKPCSFADSLDLFFQDYSIGPLFVQENYLNVRPVMAQGDKYATLDLLSKASDDIAMGDIVSHKIQSNGAGAWSLLPVQAVFACLRPGRFLRGPLPGGPGGVAFPSWFGKNSTQNKNSRLLSELSQHLRLSTHGGATDPRSVLLDYLQPIAVRLSAPLKEGDVNSVLESLSTYQLLREDMDNIMDLSTWQGRTSIMKTVDPKVKSALTRAYNKSSHMVPYLTGAVPAGGRKRTAASENVNDDEDDANKLLAGSDSDANSDAEDLAIAQSMTSKKPKPSANKPSSSSKETSKRPSKSATVKKTKGKKSDL